MSIIEKALEKSATKAPRPAPVDDAAPSPEPHTNAPYAASSDAPTTPTLVDLGPDDFSNLSDVFERLDNPDKGVRETGVVKQSSGAAGPEPDSRPESQARGAGVEAVPGPSAPVALAPGGPQPDIDDQRMGAGGASVDIDFKKLAALGFITPDTLESATAEQHRTIKRPLLRKVAEGSGQPGVYNNLILVTSSVPGEGKTFTSVNLAISMAMELDHTVLLVDTDVARSGVANTLGIDYQHGLTDYLRNEESDLGKLLVKTNIPNLTVLPVGKSYSNTTELLSSQEMLRLRDELATRYSNRIVIFDSPPLLAVTGTSVLTEIVGQIVLVVEAVRTSKGALREALRLLSSVPESRIGIVLNKSRESTRSSYHYGYYGKEQGA